MKDNTVTVSLSVSKLSS